MFNLPHLSVKSMVCIHPLIQMSKWRIEGFVICKWEPEAERGSGLWLLAPGPGCTSLHGARWPKRKVRWPEKGRRGRWWTRSKQSMKSFLPFRLEGTRLLALHQLPTSVHDKAGRPPRWCPPPDHPFQPRAAHFQLLRLSPGAPQHRAPPAPTQAPHSRL